MRETLIDACTKIAFPPRNSTYYQGIANDTWLDVESSLAFVLHGLDVCESSKDSMVLVSNKKPKLIPSSSHSQMNTDWR